MSETLLGADEVHCAGCEKVASGTCEHRGDPHVEDSYAVGPKFIPLMFVRETHSEAERSASRLRAQCAKRNNVYVFSVEEIKAACDQVSQIAESMLGQTGGLPGDVVLHLLKGILEGTASLRGEGHGQETATVNVLTDVAEHGDITRIVYDANVVPVAGAL